MALPFTAEQFFHVFERYNAVIWPIQLVVYGLGGGAVALSLFRSRYADMLIGGILAILWFWVGIVYHVMFFAQISPAARLFGLMFIVQGALLQWEGVLRKRLSFLVRPGAAGVLGALLVAYAMALYPLINHLAGHGYPRTPSFGVTPCPATIFTFGLLLWTSRRVPKYLLVIPTLWAALGTVVAISLGIYADLGLTAAAAVAVPAIILKDRRLPPGWAPAE
jgi:uncharacterized membrane protein